MGKYTNLHRILGEALSKARPDGAGAIDDLICLISDLAKAQGIITWQDGAGNLWADTRAEGSSTLFSAHLDTVHRFEGPNPVFVPQSRIIHTGEKAILGADDGAGCALIASMMLSGIRGLFLWTQGEECGSDGMRYAIEHHSAQFDGIKRAIAFDRRGQTDVCGYQNGEDRASRQFVETLALELGMGHKWGFGSFTDNSLLSDLIPEIVNISVGYENEHTKKETLDLNYLESLHDAALIVGWDDLPVIGPEKAPASEWKDHFWAGDELDKMADDLAHSLFVAIGSPEHDAILEAIQSAYDLGHFEGGEDARQSFFNVKGRAKW